METEDLVEQSRHASAAEQAEHWERVNADRSRFTALEFARRGASRSVTALLAAIDAEPQAERKQLLALVIAIGGTYIVEIERQINGEPTEPGRINHIVRNYFDSLYWIDSLKEIYQHPNEIQNVMLDVLQSASAFFKKTIDDETRREQ